MKKIMLLLFAFTIFLVGCNDETEDEDTYDFTGINLGNFYMEDSDFLTIFVEDTLGGNELKSDYYYDYDIQDYDVEAYRVLLTKDTVFLMEETGAELDLHDMADEMWFHIGVTQRIDVKTVEKFEQIISVDRDEYITFEQRLLPMYTAEKIRIPPFTYEDFISMVLPFNNEFLTILMIVEDYMDYDWDLYDEYQQKLDQYSTRDSPLYLSSIANDEYTSYYLKPLNIEEYPTFLVIDESGELLRSTAWDDVSSYLEENFTTVD
ncbi:hypothetical protein QA612_02145 [Evansella sp. AB-P1]|uniref:hypothetical protein n=1 Tax=Evansella sp. AB-P1 TaxID=3037653 RepID=UPI00241D7B0F|nr:hypothetical protein [Evansella sp. AB-P1]MDG5786274.1 hypothetical protein [Evansella sp. AB-P1]